MFAKQALLIPLATLFITLHTFGAENLQTKELLSESLHIYNELEQIKTQKNEATEELNESLKTLRLKINALKEPIFDQARIRHYKNNIGFAEDQIAVHEAAIEFATITDPQKRAELAQTYDKQREKILTEELQAAKPFSKRIDALEKETEGRQKIFAEAMKPFFRWPKEGYPAIVRTEIKAEYHAGTVTYEWWDAENTHQAFCYAQIKLTDKTPSNNNKMLDDTYSITRLWAQTIEVQANCFKVILTMRNPDLWGDEKMRGYIKEFVDLDGLAQINPVDGKKQTEELIRGSLAYAKKYQKIRNEKMDIVKPLTDERVKTKYLISILKDPPIDNDQIRKEKEQIDFYLKERQGYQTRLEAGTLEGTAERTALLKTLQADKKKLDAQKRSTGKPYLEKKQALTRGLKEKDALLSDALKDYFHAHPEGFEGLGEMVIQTSFSRAEMSCSWTDAQDETVCWAILYLRNYDDRNKIDNHTSIGGTGGGDRDFVWLWIGNIRLYFQSKNEDHLQTEPIDRLVKKFIDLSGLEAISVF